MCGGTCPGRRSGSGRTTGPAITPQCTGGPRVRGAPRVVLGKAAPAALLHGMVRSGYEQPAAEAADTLEKKTKEGGKDRPEACEPLSQDDYMSLLMATSIDGLGWRRGGICAERRRPRYRGCAWCACPGRGRWRCSGRRRTTRIPGHVSAARTDLRGGDLDGRRLEGVARSASRGGCWAPAGGQVDSWCRTSKRLLSQTKTRVTYPFRLWPLNRSWGMPAHPQRLISPPPALRVKGSYPADLWLQPRLRGTLRAGRVAARAPAPVCRPAYGKDARPVDTLAATPRATAVPACHASA